MEAVLADRRSTLGAILLIAGCCIGAGMIGLPVMSAMAGLMPTTLAMFVCYLFATGTGLLILEATLWFDEKVNLISMAGFALGKVGQALTWFLFLFLFYCIFVAYIDGGGQLFSSMLSTLFAYPVAREVGVLSCVAFVGLIVYGGTQVVSNVNRLFLLGLALSFFLLLSYGAAHVQTDKLMYTNWNAVYATIPILLLCFGYQNMMPTLIYYVNKDVNAIRIAIFVGNLIPFAIYFIWNFVILGILPEGSVLSQVTNQTDMVTGLLEKTSQSAMVVHLAKTFSFFGILTPFIANTMAFVDFLKDGLKISKETKYDLGVYALVLVPPTLLTMLYPHLFLKALGIAGGFADVILFGILPVLIVGIGRYVKGIKGPYTAPGGKLLLAVIFVFSIAFLLIKG